MEEAAINPMAVMKAAAVGDYSAHRMMADHLAKHACANNDPVTIIESLVFARLAATSGIEDDIRRLVVVISRAHALLAANEPLCISLRAEALAHVAILADAGSEMAGDLLVDFTARSQPEAVALSKTFRERLLAS